MPSKSAPVCRRIRRDRPLRKQLNRRLPVGERSRRSEAQIPRPGMVAILVVGKQSARRIEHAQVEADIGTNQMRDAVSEKVVRKSAVTFVAPPPSLKALSRAVIVPLNLSIVPAANGIGLGPFHTPNAGVDRS